MAIRKLASLVLLVTIAFGCSKQGEGERCNPTNADQDCEDGLVCLTSGGITCDPLSGNDYNCKPHRCCPQVGSAFSDSRCIGYTVREVTAGTGGSNSGIGTGGNSSLAGASAGGDSATGGSTGTAETGGSTSTDVDAGDASSP